MTDPQTLHRILIPFDFSDPSLEALKAAAQLALPSRSLIQVVHVIEEQHPPQEPGIFEEQEKIEAAIDQCLGEAEISIQKEIHLRTGRPFEKILEEIEKSEADLIVMGSHGRKGLERFLMGSVAEKIVRHSSIPVWVQRGVAKKIPKKILVPIDFSGFSRESLEMAVHWAERLNAEIYLIHIIDLRDLYLTDHLANTYDRATLEKKLFDEAQEKISQWAEHLSVPHRLEIRFGSPAVEIEKEIEKEKIDLVVLSTHGRTGLKHFFMGSVAENVVRSAPCSVLTFRPHVFRKNQQPFTGEDQLEDYLKSCRE